MSSSVALALCASRMRATLRTAATSAFVFGAVSGMGADTPFASLQAKYAQETRALVAQCQSALSNAPIQYLRELQALDKKLVTDGDLEALLHVRNEKARFEVARIIAEPHLAKKPLALVRAQAAYLDSLKLAEMARVRNQAILDRQYLDALVRLRAQLTKAERIEDAMVVHNAIERLRVEQAGTPALAKPTESRQPTTSVPAAVPPDGSLASSSMAVPSGRSNPAPPSIPRLPGPSDKDWVSPATGMPFVWIPQLKLWVGKYEVTNHEYRRKVPDHDSKDYEGSTLNGERQPVVYVNFDDAKAFADWLTQRDRAVGGLPAGWRYRLPSEQEWQAFAQCGDGREYPWGGSIPPKYGNYCGQETKGVAGSTIDGYHDGNAVTCDVTKSGKNDWDLYGVGGNVWEAAASDSSGGSFGAWRGASWRYYGPGRLRCDVRNNLLGGSGRDNNYGFRLVLSR